MGLDLPLLAADVVVRALSTRPARTATRRLAELALRAQPLLPTGRIEALAGDYLRASSTCCEKGTAHQRFAERFLADVGETTFSRARTYLREGDPRKTAARLDAWVRIAMLGELRSAVLYPRRGRTVGDRQIPDRLLNQAQLALYPHCDLACEGCFTEEERTGRAPTAEQVAWLVDEVASCGASVVHIVGKGEPFLSASWASGLLSVLEARPHLFFTLATHGMSITDEQAERLARAGNVLLLVSVDGPRPIHDARRGAGSYDRVMDAFARLRRAGALFGYSCMVSKKSFRELSSAELVSEMAAQGCSVGVHSRYFPLSPGRVDELSLSPSELAAYQVAFAERRRTAPMPLIDLDDEEQHSGCHSRTGESVYVDGITGAVTPCLRVPFAPEDCRLDRAAGVRLGEILSRPFFEEYRARTGPCPSWCGADLAGELRDVERIIAAHGGDTARLSGYRERSPGDPSRATVRHLPIVPAGAAR